jgi:peptidoglycan/LPS O-acetylase OafA/YrhL
VRCLVVESTASPPAAGGQRISDRPGSVDRIRGAAAMFVILHHTWLGVWREFPPNAGPARAGWMLYGQHAVAVFIVASGSDARS